MNREFSIIDLFTAIVITALIAILITLAILLEYPLNIVFPVLLFIVILIVFFYYLGGIRDKPSPFVLARIIADYHLTQIGNIPEFNNLRLNQSYPIYSLNNDSVIAYDVKLIDDSGADKGFILVNLDRSDSPVIFFTSEGPSITEILKRQAIDIDEEDVRVVYLSPTYIVALDSDNKIVASIGDYILKKDTVERYQDSELSTMDYLSLIRDEMREHLSLFKKLAHEEWKELLQGVDSMRGGGTKGKVKSSLPHPDFWTYYAEGYERSPKLRQIPKNTGVNDTGNWSGCGATAWTTFIRWHDLLWTPELLLGSQDVNGDDWGPIGHPNREEEYNCYNDRVIMELNDVLQTHGVQWNDTGYVWEWDMDQGFDYIEGLGHDTSSRTHWESHSTSVQKAHDYIRYKHRPVVIMTPGHYCVLEGFCHNLNTQLFDKQWLYINTGWSSPAKGYLKAKHLEKIWYTSHIRPRTQYTYNQFIGSKGVEFCTTRLSATSQKPDNLWAFWLTEDGRINYVRTANLEFPPEMMILNPQTQVTLNITSMYAPSTCADDNAIYLVYVDTNKKIHLMQYLLWKEDPDLPEANRWKELSFPDIVTEVRPAITGGAEDWLTIAFYNLENGVQKIATNKDVARPSAWPESIHWEGEIDTGAQSSWFPIGGVDGTANNGFCIARFRGHTVLGWVHADKVSFWCSEGGGLGDHCEGYEDTGLFPDSTPSLAVFNDTLFATYAGVRYLPHRDEYGLGVFVKNVRISFPGRYYDLQASYQAGHSVYTRMPGSVNIIENCRLTETTVHDPSIVAFGSSVVLGWLDDNNRLTVRPISIDTAREPINYAGSP